MLERIKRRLHQLRNLGILVEVVIRSEQGQIKYYLQQIHFINKDHKTNLQVIHLVSNGEDAVQVAEDNVPYWLDFLGSIRKELIDFYKNGVELMLLEIQFMAMEHHPSFRMVLKVGPKDNIKEFIRTAKSQLITFSNKS